MDKIILLLSVIPATAAAIAIYFKSRYSLTEDQSYSMR